MPQQKEKEIPEKLRMNNYGSTSCMGDDSYQPETEVPFQEKHKASCKGPLHLWCMQQLLFFQKGW